MSLIYKIFKLKTKSWIKNWIYNQEKAPEPVYPLSEILTGESLTLTNGVRKKFNIFNISGNTIQDGTPTPEEPIPIQNVSGEVEDKVENKNIYNSSLAVNNMYQNYNNPYWSMSPNNNYWCTGLQKIKPNSNYTISTTPNITVCYDKNRNPIPQGLRGATITTQATAYYMNCCYTKNGLPFGSDLQIEEGSTATSYEPHEEQTATLPLAEGQVLCAGDTLEDDGIHKRRGVLILKGTEAWVIQSPNTPNWFYSIALYYGIQVPICTHYKGAVITTSTTEEGVYFTNSNFRVRYGSQDTVENFKSYLAQQYANGTPVTVEYTLPAAEQTIIPYTAEQQTAYDNLKNLYSYKGTTYISSTNAPSPVFEVQYYMEGDDV